MTIGFVMVFMVGDRVLDRVRLPHVEDSSNEARWKWELYQRTEPRPDVVFIGCSFGLCGISPTAVDDRVRALTGETIHSLNLCATAASVNTEYLLVRHMVKSGRLPDVVYLGVSPVATVAVPHSWLESGLRALGGMSDLPVAASLNRVLLSETLGATLFASYRQWKDCRLIARRIVCGASLHPKSKLQQDHRGWAKWVGGVRRTGDKVADRKPGTLNDDVFSTFGECNPNPKALRDSVRLLREAGVIVRLLEMPHKSTNRPATNPRKNPVYRAFIDRAVSDLDIPLVQPDGDLVADSDFFDPWHLDAGGAQKLSYWLARDVALVIASRRPADPTVQIALGGAGTGTD